MTDWLMWRWMGSCNKSCVLNERGQGGGTMLPPVAYWMFIVFCLKKILCTSYLNLFQTTMDPEYRLHCACSLVQAIRWTVVL